MSMKPQLKSFRVQQADACWYRMAITRKALVVPGSRRGGWGFDSR